MANEDSNNNLDKIKTIKAEIFDLQIIYMRAKSDIEDKMLELKALEKEK